MKVNNLVRIVEAEDQKLNDQEGIIVGFHGTDYTLVKFNHAPEGYDPVICISKFNLKQI